MGLMGLQLNPTGSTVRAEVELRAETRLGCPSSHSVCVAVEDGKSEQAWGSSRVQQCPWLLLRLSVGER